MGRAQPAVEAIRPCLASTTALRRSQLAVALYEHELPRTDVPLSWPYLAALGLSILGSGLAPVDGRRHLGRDRRSGLPISKAVQAVGIFLVATAVQTDSLDLSAHPGQIAYPLAYVAVFAAGVGILRWVPPTSRQSGLRFLNRRAV